MHPTKHLSSSAYGIVLVALVLGEWAATGVGSAQEPASGDPSATATAAKAVPASDRKKAEASAVPRVVNASAVPRGDTIIVTIGTTRALQMKGKKEIETAVVERANVAVASPKPGDNKTVLITGREAGTTFITLTAADKTEERYVVVVEVDIEYLRSVLQRAVPTANLELIPSGNGTVVFGGTVTRSEDIDIILRTAASILGSPDKIINAMRVGGVMSVQLDVVIAQVSRNAARTMGFEFLNQGFSHSIVSAFGGGASTAATPTAGAGTTGTAGAPGTTGAASFVPPTIGQSANLVLGLFNLENSQTLFAFLEALRTENVSKLLAQPSVVALSGHSAFFNSGGQQAVPQIASGSAGGGAVAGVNFVAFGTQLSVLPIVLGNGKIYLEVDPKTDIPVSDPLIAAPIPGTGGSTFGRSGQEVRTSVVMEDGQTLVLGGLIQHTVDATVKKVPFLGDLPFLGTFFSTKSFTEGDQELVIIITPHVIDALSCDQVPRCLPGLETRSPDDFELFFEGILEAPRGPREVFQDHHYVPAYKNGPTAAVFPCGGLGQPCSMGCARPEQAWGTGGTCSNSAQDTAKQASAAESGSSSKPAPTSDAKPAADASSQAGAPVPVQRLPNVGSTDQSVPGPAPADSETASPEE